MSHVRVFVTIAAHSIGRSWKWRRVRVVNIGHVISHVKAGFPSPLVIVRNLAQHTNKAASLGQAR